MSLDAKQLDPARLPALVSISMATGQQLIQAAADRATVSVWLPDYSSFDPNAILLWIVAVATFTVAGIVAGNDCTSLPPAGSLVEDHLAQVCDSKAAAFRRLKRNAALAKALPHNACYKRRMHGVRQPS